MGGVTASGTNDDVFKLAKHELYALVASGGGILFGCPKNVQKRGTCVETSHVNG
jgi:hypothetical protein